jgi:transcriptional regulator with XRE-family HTH domain
MSPDMVLQRYPDKVLPWLRGRLGLTRRDFAERIGVTETGVARWERGRNPISLPAHRRIVLLLARHLMTAEGAAFVRSLGQPGAGDEALPGGDERLEEHPG